MGKQEISNLLSLEAKKLYKVLLNQTSWDMYINSKGEFVAHYPNTETLIFPSKESFEKWIKWEYDVI